jgi:hypothetical protein
MHDGFPFFDSIGCFVFLPALVMNRPSLAPPSENLHRRNPPAVVISDYNVLIGKELKAEWEREVLRALQTGRT